MDRQQDMRVSRKTHMKITLKALNSDFQSLKFNIKPTVLYIKSESKHKLIPDR